MRTESIRIRLKSTSATATSTVKVTRPNRHAIFLAAED